MARTHIRTSMTLQTELINKLKDIASNQVHDGYTYSSFTDECSALLYKIDKEYHWTVTSLKNIMNQISSAVDQYGEQLENQLSHSNKLHSFITTQKPSVLHQRNQELQHENQALYKLLRSTKHFSTSDLQKRIHKSMRSLDGRAGKASSADSNKFVSFIHTMDAQQIALRKNIKSYVPCSCYSDMFYLIFCFYRIDQVERYNVTATDWRHC